MYSNGRTGHELPVNHLIRSSQLPHGKLNGNVCTTCNWQPLVMKDKRTEIGKISKETCFHD